MRAKFDEELDQLNKELIAMGALCEDAIAKSAGALVKGDLSLARGVPELSARIDRKEREIEGMCLRLLMRQQPVARDLRVISSALKMVTDMERIGDQSADIAEIVLLANAAASQDAQDVEEMAAAVMNMVTESIDAFVRRDTGMAKAVVDHDDVVDGCFDRIKKALIRRLSQPDANGESAVDLLMIAKYFERIGDHAVNIAQWVIFSITGEKDGGALG